MRFTLSTPPSKGLRLPRNPSEWPLVLRFALFMIPAGLCVAMASLWLGYRASSESLMQSIEAVPLLEAKNQAEIMSSTLEGMRTALSRIAQTGPFDERAMRASLDIRFHDSLALVQEITVHHEDGGGFMLLRDPGGFVSMSVAEASSGPDSPLQQIATSPLHKGRATLYPPVYFADSAAPGQSHEQRVPVMRMAMPLADSSGTVVLGINLVELRHRLAAIMAPESALRMPMQEGVQQLSFYFDARGWILFEMDNSGSSSYLPDIAREGYSGDLGRAGYAAAFRPWAMHENFWRMVTEIAAGRSGSISAPADKYTAAHVGSTGILCFAPVFFAPAEGLPAQPLGGIAFFETSTLPLAAFLRLANFFLAVIVGSLLIFGFLAWRLRLKVALPMSLMAEKLEDMVRSSDLRFLAVQAGCVEQERFRVAVNGILAKAMSTRSELDHLSREVHQSLSRQPVALPPALPPGEAPESDYGLLGSSALIREVREHVRKAARAGTDVLIWGETGTGKELVAAAIHKAGTRSKGPYISINCGALDENLLLDALFGHVKGAFTEARGDRKGAFLAADGGTLHLDEIANASLKVQQSLLRALSVRRIRVLGTDEEIAFDTRVVAATNVDLRECVRAGTFREDLYYRLAIISIETPPLRHRKEDIPELAAFCIADAAKALGRQSAQLSRGALDLMAAHDWPGNVREFKNCLTRAMAFVEGDIILRQHITLEQDAFRTYAKPISPQVLAGRMLSPEHAAQAAAGQLTPAQVTQGQAAAGQIAPGRAAPEQIAPGQAPPLAGARGNGGSSEAASGPQKGLSGLFSGAGLWPEPLADAFSPARSEFAERRRTEPAADIGAGPRIGDAARAPANNARREFLPAAAKTRHSPGQAAAEVGRGQNQTVKNHGAAESVWPDTRGLSERQLRALAFIHEHGELSRAEYGSLFGSALSARTAQNDLRELVERGILIRVGGGPGTRYRPA